VARAGGKGFGLLIGIVVIGWLLSGIYIVDQGKRGVVLRFGRYVDTTQPGPHWHIPYPVEAVEIVDVEIRRAVEIGYRSGGAGRSGIRTVPREALMLTQDENIVDIRLAVQYQISNPRDYLFNVVDPDLTLKQVVESAARQVVGKAKMDFVLTEGRSDVVAQIKSLSQNTLDKYVAGLQVVNVNLQDAQPPEEVQEAFADAIKAREDEQRFKNQAEAYSNEVIPKARGAAARQLEEANAYRSRAIAESEGEAQRFENLLAEYQKAREVTRERLYLETMEQIMSNNPKVLIDLEKGNNLLYLPLDRLGTLPTLGGADGRSGTSSSATSAARIGGAGAASQRLRELDRDRGTDRRRENR
jgi:membrane protease subunit HflK